MTLHAIPGTLEIISALDSARPDAPGTGNSSVLSNFGISSDGRYVVFLSSATNLVLNQSSAGNQVFLRDRTSNTTQLLSGSGGSATTATGINSSLSISADGRYVVFSSTATDLVSQSTTGTQVFLYDRLGNFGAGGLTLVSHKASSLTASGASDSTSPMISRDGSAVAFTSTAIANDLVSPYATGSGSQVFRYNVATGAITLATPKNGAVTSAQGIGAAASWRAISDDGRWIGFTSNASNALSTATSGGGIKFFLFDSVNGTTRLLSRQSGTLATPATGGSAGGGGISSDGRYVTFLTSATNLISGQAGGGTQLFLYNRVTDTITLISHSASDPTAGANQNSAFGTTTFGLPIISSDGRFVVFASAATDLVSGYTGGGIGIQYYLYDRLGNSGAGSVTLITHTTASATAGTAGNFGISSATISPGGSRVVFAMAASDVVSGMTDGAYSNVYSYSTTTGALTFVSGTAVDIASVSTTGGAYTSVVSADGTFIAFRSDANDLAANDTNGGLYDLFGFVQSQVVITPEIYSEATASGTAGTAFSYTITATNTPTSYSLVSGTLPTGVTGNASTGVVSGTPTQSGTFNVTLGATNTAGTGSLALTITLAVGVPTVTAISPTTGTTAGGTPITLTGAYFMDATDVKFGAVSGTSLTVVSDSSITVTSPAGSAGAVDLTVTTPGGTSATHSGDSFTYVAPAEFTYATNNGAISITGYTFIPLDGVVVIPDTIDGDPVTSIAANAFDNCTSLTRVTIPASVTIIGESAFDDCTNLVSVTMGNGVTSIGDYAFVRCTSLTSVTIPNSVISIGVSAFDDCASLTSVTIGNSVISIGDYAFVRCTGLTSVTIPASVTSIGVSAFEDCSGLTSVTIGSGVTSIGDAAFANCTNLTSVIIPDSVTTIGDSVFVGCTSLIGPAVDSVDVPANGTYGIGRNLDFILHYLENAFVTGTPSIGLTIGSTARTANYISGDGTHHLRFRYTIQTGENDTNGIAADAIVTLNGGTIQNLAGVDAALTFSAASTSGVLVDTVSPQVVSITRKTPSAQSLVATSVIFEVTFSEDISGLGANSFAVRAVSGGSVTGVIASITGGPRIYAVTVNLTGGTGNFRLEVITAPPLGATEFASGFSGAFAMTSDAQGNLYVPVTSDHSIRKIAPDGTTSTYASSASLVALSGMAFNSAGDLYVTNSGYGNLYKVTTAGVVTLFASGFSIPAGLAIDTSDNIYVANSNDGVVKRITPLGVVSIFATGLGEPRGLAFDGAGNLFVGDIKTNGTGNRVRKVTPDGTVTTFATGISTPYGLVFDSNGTLYVTAAGLYKVSQVTPGGVVSPAALAPGYPTALTLAGGTLHMLEYDTGKVSKLTPAPVADLAGNELTGLPFTTGQIYTRVTPAISSIVRKTPTTSVLAGNSAVFEVTFSVPVTGVVPSVFEVIAINGSTVVGTVSSVSGGPSVYDITVEITSGFGDFRLYGGTTNPIITTFASGFSNPTALAFDGAGDLYVANYDNNTVSKVTSGGSVSEFASGFAGPTDLVFDSQGILYVTNNGDGSLRKVMSDGSVSTFVTGLAWPVGLAVDGTDNIYVSASDDNAVWMVASDGSATVFASGFNTPNALAFDSDGNLYVANQGDNSVSKVTSDGSSWSSVSNSIAGADGLAFDSVGTLYVTNNGNNTVSSLTSDLVLNIFAAGIGQPTGLAIDSQGRLYVASQSDGTITRLQKPGVMADLIGVPLSGLPYALGEAYTYDPNDTPTDIALSNSTVNQSAGANATVGTLTTTDADSGDTHAYTLVSGTGATNNGSFNLSGATVRANNSTALAAGSYSVRIETNDGNGGTYAKAFAIVVVDNIAPNAPSSFSAIATGSAIALSWVNPVSNFASCTIRRSASAYPTTISSGTAVGSGLTGTSRNDTPLADGTYYYAIFALDAAGNVSNSATASATVDTTAPAAPVLSASTSGSAVALAWTIPVDTASLTIRRSTSAYPASISGGTLVGSNIATTTTSLNQNGLADGTYYYAIFAFDAVGNVSNGGTASATVDATAPNAPTAFSAVATGSAIALSWMNPASDFASCTIRRSTSAFPTTISAGTAIGSGLTSTSLSQTSLVDGTYYYAIFALDATGNISNSVTASAIVDTTAPNAPTAFTAVVAGSTIALNWTNPVSDFASCTIRRSTSAYPTTISSDTAVGSGLTGTSRNDTPLADGTYYYAIFAIDAAGNASSRTMASATVDTTGPTVTDAKISISGASGTGGTFKVGDTVTATWNNTAGGDNNAETLSAVTVNFTQFGGGAAVVASNSSGTWTAICTIVAGTIDAANRNVSITATDSVGNPTTTADTTNASVDSQVPTVTAANIFISGASGTAGAFKAGDTVTAIWNNTAGGDSNADTLSAISVDFTQFGGSSAISASNSSGTWMATYTIVVGFGAAGSRNVTVTVTDNAGNTTTTTDNANATIGNTAPVNRVPGAQSLSQAGSLIFSSGGNNMISVGDVDAGGALMQVTLTATHGKLTLSSISGLSFVSGSGTADTTMTFAGTLANINVALNGLNYAPTGGYYGAATLQITTNDLGNSGSGGALADTDSIVLTISPVTGYPVILIQPESQLVLLGAGATFSVMVNGAPTLSFQWMKDGVALSGATGRWYTIPSPAANNAGGYTVVVSNSVGSVTSDIGYLAYISAPGDAVISFTIE